MKAALYARVSTLDQHCELQTSQFREFCARRGWENAREYVDTGFSGAKASRPELLQLKADAQKHLFDAVVVWKLDRFGRSTLDCLEGIKALDRQGVRFLSLTEPIDTDEKNPMARFMMTILAAVAELEREMIRERSAAGLSEYRRAYAAGEVGKRRNSKSGKNLPVGRPRVVFDRAKARSMRAKGASIRDIMRKLHVGSSAVQEALKNGQPPSK